MQFVFSSSEKVRYVVSKSLVCMLDVLNSIVFLIISLFCRTMLCWFVALSFCHSFHVS